MKKFLILILSVALLLVIFPLTLGWLSLQTRIDLPLTGGIFTNYFHSGNGSEQNPYTITKPQHLYNLTMLYQELEDFDEEGMYFELSNSIDCSGIENFLPIGTISHPFRGNFNGNDFTIDNLTIIGSGESDIGFFGYVDDCAAVSNVYIEDLVISIDDCSTAASSVTVGHTAHSTSICYIGYIAGHIADATCFENVYVNNCEITGTASNFESKWGYFGYCENAATLEDFIARVGGEDPSWGGSVNMQKMYNRLYDIASNATTNSNYAFEKDIITKVDGTTFERDALTGYAYTYRSQKEGSFVFTRYSSQNGPLSNFMYLNGGSRMHPYSQTETQVTGGYKITYNGHYLGISNISIVDHEDAWQYSNNILSIAIDGITYFLTHNLTLSTTTQEEWTKNGNRLYYTSGGIFGIGSTYHYITYNNG